MTKPLLIQGGRIIDPSQGIDEIGSLLITDGKISWLGKSEVTPPQPDYDVLPARGLIVCPGFIDHCEDTVLTEGGQMNEGIISTVFQGKLVYKDGSVKLEAKGKL